MTRFASRFGSHPVVRLALIGCLAGLLAGCADSERLADPFSNPFNVADHTGDPLATGTIARRAPTTRVQSRPLPPPAAAPGVQSAYTAPAYPSPRLSPSPSYGGQYAQRAVARRAIPGWSAEGGMPIIVAPGETAKIIADRYSIPERALLRTNGLSSPRQVVPGTHLVIPVYNAALATSSGAPVGIHHPAPRRSSHYRERLVFVRGPRGLTPQQAAAARAALRRKHAQQEREAQARAQRRARRSEHQTAQRTHSAPEHARKLAAKAHAADTVKVAKLEPPKHVQKAPAVDHVSTASVAPAKKGAAAHSSRPRFSWPAHGRIIRAFKVGRNDGINIALPQGTAVRAAEAGIVAYAGDELKGYGNLILIRHPDGYVTAYANNEKIEVKRGEKVRRGQVIAKSGETGNVSTPQLHFELRKGAKPLNPVLYLGS